MNARNTSSAPRSQTRRTGPPGTGGQWWKAWVLLTGLGATVFGWMAFPHGEQPAANGGISPQVSMSAENEPLLRVEPIDSPRIRPTSARTLPAMPQKPVYQAPVTRTRRS
jgi:hypothetical protein